MPDFPSLHDAEALAGAAAAVIEARAHTGTALAPDEIDLLLALARRRGDDEAHRRTLAMLDGPATAGLTQGQGIGATAALAATLLTASHPAGQGNIRDKAASLLPALMDGSAAATTDALGRAAVALLQASWVLDRAEFGTAALLLVEALVARARPGDGLLRRIADPDAADEPALADQVEAGRALLDAYETTGHTVFLQRAQALAGAALTYFGDIGASAAGTAQDKARAAEWLARLSMATGDTGYLDQAKGILEALRDLPVVGTAGPTAAAFALACLRVAEEPVHIVIPGAQADPRTRALLDAALRVDHWHRLAQAADPVEDGDLLDALGYYGGPQPLAYVCYNLTCSPPISDPAQIAPAVTRMASTALAAAADTSGVPAPAPFLNLGGGLGRGPIIGFGPGSGGFGGGADR